MNKMVDIEVILDEKFEDPKITIQTKDRTKQIEDIIEAIGVEKSLNIMNSLLMIINININMKLLIKMGVALDVSKLTLLILL